MILHSVPIKARSFAFVAMFGYCCCVVNDNSDYFPCAYYVTQPDIFIHTIRYDERTGGKTLETACLARVKRFPAISVLQNYLEKCQTHVSLTFTGISFL